MDHIQEHIKIPRSAGLLFPVFSMRREGDLGIGDTVSVKKSIDWLSESNVGFLQLLPINVSGSDNSPYSAISSVALDFIYLHIESIPEISDQEIEAAKSEFGVEWLNVDTVNYELVRKVKGSLLRLGFDRFKQSKDEGEDARFRQFCEDEFEWLGPYTKYRWLMEEAGGSEDWMTWPEEFNTAKKAYAYEIKRELDGDVKPESVQEYYAWVQWHAFSQWKEVREYADSKNVKLMGDIPIGVSSASADVFFESQWFIENWYGGAPPETKFKADAFTTKWGQNWGVPLYDWEKLEESNFSWWRRRITKLTDIFNIFRIDHILGFYRIYAFPWHPKRNEEFLPLSEDEAKELTGGDLPRFMPRADDSMKHKAENLLAGDLYLNAILEAAEGAEVVGEDLGFVPEYVRPHLLEIGVAGFKVCHWERNAQGGVVLPEEHPDCSFATYSTHDHPPIPSMWEDLRQRALNGSDEAWQELTIMGEFAEISLDQSEEVTQYDDRVKWQLLDALMKSGARYSALLINDIIDSKERINLPGTVGSHNWTYRVPWDFERIPSEVATEMARLSLSIANHERVVPQSNY